MKVGDLVAWHPSRARHIMPRFVGIVVGEPVGVSPDGPHQVPVVWSESATRTVNDIRDLKVLESTIENW